MVPPYPEPPSVVASSGLTDEEGWLLTLANKGLATVTSPMLVRMIA
jgi:hypothetical protein